MFLVYNADGSIKYPLFQDYIMQGSNRVNKIFVAFIDHDATTYSCSALFNLPNGETTTELGVYDSNGFVIDGVTYVGYVINITSAETFYAGNVKCSIRLTNSYGQILYSYIINLIVNASVIDPDTPITAAEYNSYLAQLGAFQLAFDSSNVRAYPSLSYLETLDTTLGTYPKNLLALNQIFFVYDSATQLTKLYKCTTQSIYDSETGLYTSNAVIEPHNLKVYDSENADLATRATSDGSGNSITGTYLRLDARQDQTLAKVANVGADGKVPLAQIPDVIKKAIFLGGTISTISSGSAIVTVTQSFKDKYQYVDDTLTISQLETANAYEGAYFLVATSGLISIDGTNYQAVNDGDWVISIATEYVVIDQGIARTYFTYDSGTGIATFETKADLSGSAIVDFTQSSSNLYGINADGENVQVPNATTSNAGAMSSTDKTTVDSIAYSHYSPIITVTDGYIGTQTCHAYKTAKTVTLNIYATLYGTGSLPAPSFSLTLSSGYRPITTVYLIAMFDGVAVPTTINSSGVVDIDSAVGSIDATPRVFILNVAFIVA